MLVKKLIEYVKVDVEHCREHRKEVPHYYQGRDSERLTITVRVHPEIKDSDNLKNTIGSIVEDIVRKAVKDQKE